MTHASSSIDIPATADTVWRLIGGFGSLPDWLPYITVSQLLEGGRLRRLENSDGDVIIERLISFADTARTYSYAIVEAPFPVTDYRSTLQVRPIGNGKSCRVEWSGWFTPEVSENDSLQLFQGIFADGLKALAANF